MIMSTIVTLPLFGLPTTWPWNSGKPIWAMFFLHNKILNGKFAFDCFFKTNWKFMASHFFFEVTWRLVSMFSFPGRDTLPHNKLKVYGLSLFFWSDVVFGKYVSQRMTFLHPTWLGNRSSRPVTRPTDPTCKAWRPGGSPNFDMSVAPTTDAGGYGFVPARMRSEPPRDDPI